MEAVTVKLPRSVAGRLRAVARRSGKPKSEIVREGIELRLRSQAPLAAGSVIDAAGDLLGCLDGPRDLATNPRHLRGFGR